MRGDASAVQAEPSTTTTWPTAPSYDFAHRPTSLLSLDIGDLESEVSGNFFRSARWCADGTAILTTSEDRQLRVYNTQDHDMGCDTLNHRRYRQPDAIHSTVWYPTASASAPETFCFVASVRDAPVRLIDAGTGLVRATYPIVDHRERFVAPHSLAFNPSATKLYCGHENAIEVLDISNPGYDTSLRLKTVSTKRERAGQRGIISALSFCNDYSGLFAAGSYSGTVSLYSEDTGGNAVQHIDGVQGGGVTQIAFHPLNPQTVFVASRRSAMIQAFDLRDTTAPVLALKRPGGTNQRLWFDVDPWGRWIASGDEIGVVRVWDIGSPLAEPIFEETLHDDAVASSQLHPYKPLLLTAAGSRSYLRSPGDFADSCTSDSDSDETSANSDLDDGEDVTAPADASMRIWSFAAHDKGA